MDGQRERDGDLQSYLVYLKEGTFPVLEAATNDLVALKVEFVFLVVIYCAIDGDLIAV